MTQGRSFVFSQGVWILLLVLASWGCTKTTTPTFEEVLPAPVLGPADLCEDPEGQLLDCTLAFRIDVPDWNDLDLPRAERAGGPKALLLPEGTDEIWVAMLVGPAAVRVYSRTTGELLTSFPLGEEGLGAVEFEITFMSVSILLILFSMNSFD